MPKNSKTSTAKNTPTAKPTFRKSPPDLIALFDSTVRPFPQIQVRQVFGYPCGFVNGYMTIGLHENKFFIRLPAGDQEEVLAHQGSGYLEVMKGRPMKDYVVLPKIILDMQAQLHSLVEKAVQSAADLPPKEK